MGEDFAGLIHGTTDSELVFHWLLSRFRNENLIDAEKCFHLGSLGDALDDAISELDRRSELAGATQPAKLNIVMTNGEVMLATRLRNPMHWLHREGVHDGEVCGDANNTDFDRDSYRAVVIASEPLSDEDWQPIPDGSVITVDRDITRTLLPMTVETEKSPS
jgi:glutamine amidotransferase